MTRSGAAFVSVVSGLLLVASGVFGFVAPKTFGDVCARLGSRSRLRSSEDVRLPTLVARMSALGLFLLGVVFILFAFRI